MKKLASDAGIFFTRAVQVRPGATPRMGPGCGARPGHPAAGAPSLQLRLCALEIARPLLPCLELPGGAPSEVSRTSLMARDPWGPGLRCLGAWQVPFAPTGLLTALVPAQPGR